MKCLNGGLSDRQMCVARFCRQHGPRSTRRGGHGGIMGRPVHNVVFQTWDVWAFVTVGRTFDASLNDALTL
ncbi:MAG: hypothetical protein KDA93_15990 [Planctomycetaceae bacterium]|nr:hypothetical protein [Planctomycetaceae bacterium]